MEYRIPVQKTPTLWNDTAALGALIGSFVLPTIGTVIGAYIGGKMGKARMENELQNGKIVNTPTFWNKKIAVGWWKGMVKGFFIAAAIGIAAGIFSSTLLAAGLGGSIWSVVTLYGAIKGGFDGKREMRREYDEGQRQARLNEQLNPGQARNVTFDNPTRERSFAADITTRRNQQAFSLNPGKA